MRLVLFDLDNTLIAGDSDYEWGQFLIDHGIVERETYEAQNRAYYDQYVAGTPCFREGKVKRVDEWLASQGRRLGDFPESVFYSDSHNDLPLLERVTRPVAVDPDPALAAEAHRRRWATMSLR